MYPDLANGINPVIILRMGDLNIFSYLDYRTFLKDWYRGKKVAQPEFSFRLFSRVAGFRSPNFYKLVMDGARNLTEVSVRPFLRGLGLRGDQQAYFRTLVFFNQARTHEQKDHYYQQLLKYREFTTIRPLHKEMYDYCKTWYHPIVREMISSPAFDGTPAWIAKRLQPRITEQQAAVSLELLQVLGMITRAGDGTWSATDQVVSTGHETSDVIFNNYHQELLRQVLQKMLKVPQDERDISALTLGIVKSQFPVIKKKIQSFREDLLKLVQHEGATEEVVIVTMQLLPMTEDPKRGDT